MIDAYKDIQIRHNNNIAFSCESFENKKERIKRYNYYWEYVYHDLSLREGEK